MDTNPRPQTPKFPLRIFFDGSCAVCAREIGHYLRRDKCGRFEAIDISDRDFDPAPYHIPLSDFRHELHAIDSSGTVFRGVEAFWAMWQAFPVTSIYGVLGLMIRLPGINGAARLLYQGFARIRHALPKRAR